MQKTKARYFRLLLWGLLFSMAARMAARASTVTETITGTVYSGTNGSAGSAYVFGTGSVLDGLAFTLTFTFDDTQGIVAGNTCSDGSLYYTNIQTNGSSNPGTAVLSITDASSNVWSFQFGGASIGGPPYTSIDGITSSVTRYAGLTPDGMSTNCYGSTDDDYEVAVSYSDGNYSGNSSISAIVVPASWPTTGAIGTSGDWRVPVTLASLDSSFADYPYFSIDVSNMSGEYQYANGYLSPTSISISSPGFSVPTSEAAVWIDWGSSADPDQYGPIGLWLQSLTVPSGSLDNIYSNWMVQEYNAPGYTPSDTCNDALVGSSFYYTHPVTLNGSIWHVTSADGWGDPDQDGINGQYDALGEPDDAGTDPMSNPTTRISYLRSLSPSPLFCSIVRYQQMKIDFGDGSPQTNYGSVNTLTATVGTTNVVSAKTNGSPSSHVKTY